MDGDTPIKLDEYQFTLTEAATVSGVPEKSIHNWMKRDILPIGRKHRLGRWQFSMLDLIRLATMHDLTQLVPLKPTDAARIADLVAKRAWERTERNLATGELRDLERGVRTNVNILVAFDEGEPKAWTATAGDPAYYPPHYKNTQCAPLRKPHITIPADAIINDVFSRLEELGDE